MALVRILKGRRGSRRGDGGRVDAQRAERERARLARQEPVDEERSNARITMLQNQADVGSWGPAEERVFQGS